MQTIVDKNIASLLDIKQELQIVVDALDDDGIADYADVLQKNVERIGAVAQSLKHAKVKP